MFGYQHVGAVAHALEDLLDDLRLGRTTPVNQELLDVLFDSVERFQYLLSREDPQSEDDRSVDDYIAAIRSVGVEPQGPAGDPLDKYAIEPEVLAVLTEYEEHRLRACIRDGLLLYRLRAAFELAAIDDSIERLRDDTQDDAEIITYLPSMEGGNEETDRARRPARERASRKSELRAQFESRYGRIEPIAERTHLPTLPPQDTSIPSPIASVRVRRSDEDAGCKRRCAPSRTPFESTSASSTT